MLRVVMDGVVLVISVMHLMLASVVRVRRFATTTPGVRIKIRLFVSIGVHAVRIISGFIIVPSVVISPLTRLGIHYGHV